MIAKSNPVISIFVQEQQHGSDFHVLKLQELLKLTDLHKFWKLLRFENIDKSEESLEECPSDDLGANFTFAQWNGSIDLSDQVKESSLGSLDILALGEKSTLDQQQLPPRLISKQVAAVVLNQSLPVGIQERIYLVSNTAVDCLKHPAEQPTLNQSKCHKLTDPSTSCQLNPDSLLIMSTTLDSPWH